MSHECVETVNDDTRKFSRVAEPKVSDTGGVSVMPVKQSRFCSGFSPPVTLWGGTDTQGCAGLSSAPHFGKSLQGKRFDC